MAKRLKSMSNILPDEVVEEILPWVPAKALVRFQCVNTGWCTLLTRNPRLVKNSLDRTLENEVNHGLFVKGGTDFYVILGEKLKEKAIKLDQSCVDEMPVYNDDGVALVGSMNGLVCLTNEAWPDPSISVWNPITRECYILPFPNITTPEPYNPEDLMNNDSLAFGFDSSINNYKVVRLVGDFGEIREIGDDLLEFSKTTKVEIFSSLTNSWKQLDDIPYSMKDKYSRAYIDGVPHWFAFREYNLVILSFDMINEVFDEVPVPNSIDLSKIQIIGLRMFKGLLSIFVVPNVGVKEMHVWVMNDYPAKDSWAPLFTIENQRFNYPIGFLKNGEAILHNGHGKFITFNSDSGVWNIIQNPEFQFLENYDSSYYDIVPYVETIVPARPTYNQVQTEQEGLDIEESKHIIGSAE